MPAASAVPSLESLARHAGLFQALSDPRRLRILDLLRGGEQCVCDLRADLDCGQSLLSFHLKTLRDVGLVTMRKEGRWSYYQLAPGAFEHAEQAVAAYRVPAHKRRTLPVGCCG
ncbi:MAG: metalloregulator ArsR/SmtB family transcription factor [Gemmatimonadota bacterium]|nr:metalloregulator ArsR/SmtB family transcription factor [Gemmatimonadota bacterium]